MLVLNYGKLADFSACERRYQLRYQRQMPWPVALPDGPAAEARDRGQRFHQLAQRHLLGLPVTDGELGDPTLRLWWRRFLEEGPKLPPGRLYPEFSMTTTLELAILTGRFDLLVTHEGSLQLYDWKTESHPRSSSQLKVSLQTRVYLTLALEGGRTLIPGLQPEQVTLSYWYAVDPAVSVTISYDLAYHQENLAYLATIVEKISQRAAVEELLPRTEDLSQCQYCAYQVFCDRVMAMIDLNEWRPDEDSFQIEPAIP